MSSYHFPGYPAFLDRAARESGHPEAAGPARRIATLAALANLCAQAAGSGVERAPAILAHAAEFRDQLHAAARAADLMLADVSEGLGIVASADDRAPADRGPGRGRRRETGRPRAGIAADS